MATTDKTKEDNLCDEQFNIEYEILGLLDNLMDAKWDSNTLKGEIESLMRQRNQVIDELIKIWDKQEQPKP